MMVAEILTGHEPHDSAVNGKSELYSLARHWWASKEEVRHSVMNASLSFNGICALRAAEFVKDIDGNWQMNLPGTPYVEEQIKKFRHLGTNPGRKIHFRQYA